MREIFHIDKYIGKKYGSFTVLAYKGKRYLQNTKYPSQFNRIFLCRCECGRKKKILLNNLKYGKTFSCGQHKRKYEHIKYGIYEYQQWIKYKQDYEPWANDFKQFLQDIGNRPSRKHFLRKLHCEMLSSPNNLYWANSIFRPNIIQRGHGNKGRHLDDLDYRDVTSERKRQLRKNRMGLCYRKCTNKIYRCGLCFEHHSERLLQRRLFKHKHLHATDRESP